MSRRFAFAWASFFCCNVRSRWTESLQIVHNLEIMLHGDLTYRNWTLEEDKIELELICCGQIVTLAFVAFHSMMIRWVMESKSSHVTSSAD